MNLRSLFVIQFALYFVDGLRKLYFTGWIWLQVYIYYFNSEVDVFFNQIVGLYTGYQEGFTDPNKNLTLLDFMVMNLQPDLDDVADAIEGDVSAKVRGNTRCSAIVKLVPNNEDLLVGHNTWTTYSQMYRTLKKYDMPLRKTGKSKAKVPTRMISFSGYPGVITSQDDFYTTSSQMVVLETTIGNYNASRWQYVTPTGQLFDSVRSLIAMRLAKNGRSWSETFSQYNSGTYNNQWIIVDLKKFKKGGHRKRVNSSEGKEDTGPT